MPGQPNTSKWFVDLESPFESLTAELILSQDGTCACHTPFHLVKHGGAHKTICQPRCVEGSVQASIFLDYPIFTFTCFIPCNRYVLSANFTTCVCAATSFESHDKTKVSLLPNPVASNIDIRS